VSEDAGCDGWIMSSQKEFIDLEKKKKEMTIEGPLVDVIFMGSHGEEKFRAKDNGVVMLFPQAA
jgi:hypothetical protein